MKTGTTHSTGILNRGSLFLGAILTVALMIPAIAVSQTSPFPVNLGTAGSFVVLAQSGISTTGATHITGDIGVSPVAASYITGFGLIKDASNQFSTSSLVTGKAYASDYTAPTPAKMTTAIGDMGTAFSNAAGRSADYTELYAGDVTGKTLTRGVYKWGTGVLVSAGGVTVSGSSTDVWIFQIAQNLTVANGAAVTLIGGAQASNIFWQVSGKVTLGTTAAMNGVILCQTNIAVSTGATLNGRALAQTAVTLDANSISSGSAAVTAVQNGSGPQEFALFQSYPNPFNPTTRIQYTLAKAGQVSLKVYNLIGNQVGTLVSGYQEAGSYTVPFGSNKETFGLSSGVYFYRLEAGSFVSTRKLILVK
jgi:hypothetical protein